MTKLGRGKLGFAKADHSEVYKQLALVPSRRLLATVLLREPQRGSWRAFLPNAQLFESAAAVLQYSGFSRVVASLATRIWKIPAMGYFGDFGMAAPLPLTEEALLAFTNVNEILGCQKSEWGQLIEFLGLILDLT